MAALPYMQLYIADYLADTMHLSTEEHGAYLLLMFNYWQTGRPIPKNRLSKIARLSNDRWDAVEPSLKEFFNDTGTEWVQERIERDLEAVKNSISQKSAAGKASAQARKAKKGANTQQNSNERSTGVNAPFEQNSNGNSTNTDTDTDTDLKEKQERGLSAQESFLPPIGKFPITDDWMPSDDFVGQAAQWGINLGECPGYTPVELQQFRDYWKCEGKLKHHLQWEQTFASSLKTSRAKTSTFGASSRRQAGFGISQPDTEIPPGFRG
ncbi:DUF1376 domain-containing protein [Enterobacter asburiae]|uniref:DUF1376 domain-containing protein n=1 Tax=Enterobacter asburiae TaxID=61645 RepID=UPI002005C415|nr:DUF1376 domain-containing protein [Enterobacter asburiae]MCK7061143.1 DUF1376 domain-containing protein [Enterobacter asburiae]HCM9117678.1 DUF1376 domain-containing protein [Enterobacter asburiae]